MNKRMKEFILYIIPWLLAVAWLIYLKSNSGAGEGLLSPIDTAPLLTALVIFIAGYMLFLAFMFSSDIKEAFLSLSKKKH